MSNKINTAYTLNSNELEKIKTNFFTHTDWENVIFEEIKTNIINHLRCEQNNRCCYCKRELGFDIKDIEIDHIIPKSKYPNFTFEPKNLALTCPGCNTKKSTNSVLNKKIIKYPKNGTAFKIIHAHYDIYEKHIKILEGLIYNAQSRKGSETITICELSRLQFIENKAKQIKTNNSDDSKLVEDLRNAPKDKIPALLKILTDKLNE